VPAHKLNTISGVGRRVGNRRAVKDKFAQPIKAFHDPVAYQNAYRPTQPTDDRRTVLKAQAANEQRNRMPNTHKRGGTTDFFSFQISENGRDVNIIEFKATHKEKPCAGGLTYKLFS
jgi:hypothetical protein